MTLYYNRTNGRDYEGFILRNGIPYTLIQGTLKAIIRYANRKGYVLELAN
jgi:hypothetical protein